MVASSYLFLHSVYVLTPSELLLHGGRFLWNWRLILLHAISDSVIALAYISIPFTLAHIVRKRKDLRFNWMALCLGAFIVACGLTHLLEVLTLWYPVYWVAGAVKSLTAAASVCTVFLLVRQVNRFLPKPAPAPATTRECPYCLSAIPLKAVKCAHCTAEVHPA